MLRPLVALTCAAAFTAAAAPAVAFGDQSSPAPSQGSVIGGVMPGSTTSPAAATPAAADAGKEYTCLTGIDEPCYVSFTMGVGTALAQFDFSEGPPSSSIEKCGDPYTRCAKYFEGIPPANGVTEGFYLSGPAIKDVEVF